VAQGLTDVFQTMKGTDGGQNVGGVGSLLATRFEQPSIAKES
jgi:hypothetical protein